MKPNYINNSVEVSLKNSTKRLEDNKLVSTFSYRAGDDNFNKIMQLYNNQIINFNVLVDIVIDKYVERGYIKRNDVNPEYKMNLSHSLVQQNLLNINLKDFENNTVGLLKITFNGYESMIHKDLKIFKQQKDITGVNIEFFMNEDYMKLIKVFNLSDLVFDIVDVRKNVFYTQDAMFIIDAKINKKSCYFCKYIVHDYFEVSDDNIVVEKGIPYIRSTCHRYPPTNHHGKYPIININKNGHDYEEYEVSHCGEFILK